MILAVDRQSRC